VEIVLILFGAWLWYNAVFLARVDDHIKGNTLATTGVRHPIYSAFLLACTGALLLADNLLLPAGLSAWRRRKAFVCKSRIRNKEDIWKISIRTRFFA